MFQKRSMKMSLHWRANLADQNTQQPQKINLRVMYHPWLLSMKQTFNLIDTCQYCSTSRANQSLHVCSLANASFQNRGVCLQTFPFFPSPFPSFQYLALVLFSHGQRIRFLGSFFAPNGNACYTGYTGDYELTFLLGGPCLTLGQGINKSLPNQRFIHVGASH